MTQKCKIDNEESDDDKLLSKRRDLGLSGRNAERTLDVFSQNTISYMIMYMIIDRSISPKSHRKISRNYVLWILSRGINLHAISLEAVAFACMYMYTDDLYFQKYSCNFNKTKSIFNFQIYCNKPERIYLKIIKLRLLNYFNACKF